MALAGNCNHMMCCTSTIYALKGSKTSFGLL
uniref:Uncharacterized protein n=1 Tax=Rhizophora mucronata TaxID=61149 RepID=A0A2P2P4F6_RHIMU